MFRCLTRLMGAEWLLSRPDIARETPGFMSLLRTRQRVERAPLSGLGLKLLSISKLPVSQCKDLGPPTRSAAPTQMQILARWQSATHRVKSEELKPVGAQCAAEESFRLNIVRRKD
jgi:hypothetical protein